MAGLSCAQAMRERGADVVLVEREVCGAGASGMSSGFITPDSEIELSSLMETYGSEQARVMWEFVVSGVERIRQTIEQGAFDCDYRKQDSLFIARTKGRVSWVEREHAARVSLGYPSTFYDRKAVRSIIGSERYWGAVRYSDTFGINARAYCLCLRDALRARGVRVFEGTRVISVDGEGAAGDGSRIRAKQIVVCTDRFLPELGVLQDKIYHIQTFLARSKPLPEQAVKAMFPDEPLMVWDTKLVYNYFRLVEGNRLLVGGGDVLNAYAKREASSTDSMRARLRSYMARMFPGVSIELESIWPGMLGVSKDLLPIVAEDQRFGNVHYVGAATGLPWAAALGAYLADKITDSRSDFDAIFSPLRRFIIGERMQSLMGTRAAFAVSHGIAKLAPSIAHSIK